MPKIFRCLSCLGLLFLALAPAAAQKEPLELSHIYGSDALDFSPDLPRIRWLPGGRDYLQAEDNGDDGVSWAFVDAATGDAEPFYDPEPLAAALEDRLRLDAEDAASRARPGSLRLSPSTGRLLLELASDLFVWDFDSETLTRLTHGPEDEELTRFSPDGRSLAFVRDADLYVIGVEGDEVRLTMDGGENTLNGKLDWVYQEEIYGRGNYQAHWWSPDSRRIAFLQTDERDVPRFTVVDHVPYRPPLEVYPYPKAGDANPRVRLGVAAAAGGDITWIDPGIYGHTEILFVNVAFSPDGDVWYQVQDRRQTFLDLHRADPTSGESKRVLREESHAWVNQLGPPHFLEGENGLRTAWKGRTAWKARTAWTTAVFSGSANGPVSNTSIATTRTATWSVHSRRGAGRSARSMPSTRRRASPTSPAPTAPRSAPTSSGWLSTAPARPC